MEIGEYIRTRLGISKIIGDLGPNVYEVDKNGHPMSNKFSYYIENGEILKHSENILDLIEVGDYVNGKKIETILEPSIKVEYVAEKILCFETDYPIEKGLRCYHNCDIKSIVTREQFKSMQYKLETEDK